MHRMAKQALIFVITLVIIIVIFWFVLPIFHLDTTLGGLFFPVMILLSIALSYGIGWLLNKVLANR